MKVKKVENNNFEFDKKSIKPIITFISTKSPLLGTILSLIRFLITDKNIILVRILSAQGFIAR